MKGFRILYIITIAALAAACGPEENLSFNVETGFEDGKILAYARVLDRGVSFETPAVGRVISMRRREGLGSRILSEGIRIAREKYSAEAVMLEAQVYARKLYEKHGFIQVSDEFLEDGIPHILMRLEL